MSDSKVPVLTRQLVKLPAAPIRIVHIGLGAFHRSHQAWYTQKAGDHSKWGIAAFTGRKPDAAVALSAQDGLFTLIDRSARGDSFEVIGSITEALDGADVNRLCELVSSPETAIITLTITEAAYGLDSRGRFTAETSGFRRDLAALKGTSGTRATPDTPIGRLVLALAARKDTGAGPIAVVSCDNLSANGEVARRAITGLAEAWDAGLANWIKTNVSFVSTSVDRITPRTTDEDISEVQDSRGYRDTSPVVAEPFHDWILSGEFPKGRPQWEDAGAVIVDDIEPYENRKLWLLNGAHSLLAYAGQLRGHATVAQALDDALCRNAVESFWDEAAKHLGSGDLHIPEYRKALSSRFSNARIAHHLSQIAADGSTKLRMRALPVLTAERSQGRSGASSALVLAAWIDYVAEREELQDPLSDAIHEVKRALGPGPERVAALLDLISHGLGQDPQLVSLVDSLTGTFTQAAGATSSTSLENAHPTSGRNS
ncbi:mannitol dehydrogenase family protein [Arthrobacter silvisoli]|uniref:mannitol dehydrogenase family protein n=1 Tax=Arthrobacter silvisoli TaxID=2291022 RepID=UPI000E20C9E2|nr:mannitol dehydrogenase family protein [Arthrobacter silvisoli]